VLGGREVRIVPAPAGAAVEGAGPELREAVLRYLGAPFDLDAFAAFASTEPVLAEVVPPLRGLRPPLVPDPFEALVTSITAQQISLRAAFSIRNRLIEAFGVRHDAAYAFPTRDRLAAARPEEIVAVGFSGRKADYVVGLARADLDLDRLARLPDDDVRSALVALPGLGEWTADWFLARHLGRPGAWPAGDLGLRKAVHRFYGPDTDVRALGVRFSRFANLAAHYLLVGHRVHG
jgi:DNA-3-methyladenine glycosylase II